MVNKQRIREMLSFQDLTEEEKQRRGILGRLYGPCASIIDATRNGRCYGDELWENVFNKNDIVREMFENGGIPMELDHPVDREETDSTRIAAMLPEAPKRDKDGHLVCYVDLIDTPCGKIAYQLAKYGFKLGISSRGSGDVREDDTVDPDTYDFTTFDLVLLPAVKDARLNMCESLDKKSLKLKKALKESYDSCNATDKNVMKSMLEELDMNFDLEEDFDEEMGDGEFEFDATPVKPIVEAKDEEEVEEVEETEEVSEDEEELEAIDVIKDKLDVHGEGDEVTIAAKGELDNENAPKIEVEVSEEEFDALEKEFHDEDGQNSEESDDIEEVESEDETEVEEVEAASEDENSEEVEETEEEVTDDESDEVIENLKEAIRQKDSLESEVKNLKESKAVSDAEVKELKEELNKYKLAYARTSEIAAKSKKAETEVKSLTEQLNQKDAELKALKQKQSEAKPLNEGVEAANKKVKILAERLRTSIQEVETKEKQLTEQANVYKQKLSESAVIAKKYKAKADEAIAEYINYRASMLGVQPKEITSKLTENYTIADVNEVCDGILDYGMPNIPFSFGNNVKVKMNESKSPRQAEEDDGFDELLELAGLK